MKTLKYVGGLQSGYVEHLTTSRAFPFVKDEPIELPEELANDLLENQPEDWVEVTE